MKTSNQTLLEDLVEKALDLCGMWSARGNAEGDILGKEMSRYFFLQAELYTRMVEELEVEDGTNNS